MKIKKSGIFWKEKTTPSDGEDSSVKRQTSTWALLGEARDPMGRASRLMRRSPSLKRSRSVERPPPESGWPFGNYSTGRQNWNRKGRGSSETRRKFSRCERECIEGSRKCCCLQRQKNISWDGWLSSSLRSTWFTAKKRVRRCGEVHDARRKLKIKVVDCRCS